MSDDTATWFENIRGHFGHTRAELAAIRADQAIILATLKELKMSETQLETDIANQTTALAALATEIQTGLASNASAIAALKAQIAAGGTVTTADLTALEGNTASVQAATAALTNALNPPITNSGT